LDGPGDGGLFITSGLSSFGFILRNVETGELRYYHSSQNNSRFFDAPHLIRTEEDLERFLEELSRQVTSSVRMVFQCLRYRIRVSGSSGNILGSTDGLLEDWGL
jgi:hypothetical protein